MNTANIEIRLNYYNLYRKVLWLHTSEKKQMSVNGLDCRTLASANSSFQSVTPSAVSDGVLLAETVIHYFIGSLVAL